MEIRKLTIAGLNQLMHSDEVAGWSSLPISHLRLASQMKNPNLDKEDIVMIIAVTNNDLVGYLGALPDNMQVGDATYHVAWASCIWTSPVYRGQGLAKRLTSAMTEVWNHNFFLTEFTADAKAVYDKLGLFETFCIKNGYRYFYKAIFYSIVKNRFSNNGVVLSMVKLFDKVFNILLSFRLLLKSSFKVKENKDWLESKLEHLPEALTGESPFVQSVSKTQWIFSNPWLTDKKENSCEKYYFQTCVDCFQFRSIIFFDRDEQPLAHLVFSNINQECKVLIFSINTVPGIKFEALKKRVEQFFVTENANTVLSYNENYNELMKQKGSLFFYRKSRQREYLVDRLFLSKLLTVSGYIPNELDGDIAFT